MAALCSIESFLSSPWKKLASGLVSGESFLVGGSEGSTGRSRCFYCTSLHLAWHSLLFEPRGGEIEARSPGGMLCEKQGMPCEELATSHSLLFAPHSPSFAPLALRGMGREESIGRREGEGTAHEELFAPLDAELASFFVVFGRLEGGGMRRDE